MRKWNDRDMREPGGAPRLDIPADLLPSDGRFGCGPSKVRRAQADSLAAVGETLLGTSHRQAPVRSLVRRVRDGVASHLGAPDGYEVLLGNGGTTSFWDSAAFALVLERAQHAVFGEFGGKFAAATAAAPFLADPDVRRAEPGDVALLASDVEGLEVDVYATPQNETSTGAIAPVARPEGSAGALTLVDATSCAGAVVTDLSECDVYYFAPQKVFGSDGGLWFAVCSPAALERIEEIAASSRWIPDSLALSSAVANSRAEQTLNTPAIATLVLLAEQLDWFAENGGLGWAAGRSAASAAHLYGWAAAREWATPFVRAEQHRSPVVGTIDLDARIDATQVIAVLRSNGILDVDPYRKLGRNQLRIGMFPAVDPSDVEALTACVDYVVEHLA